jgi:two-component system, NarL family, nitrate/nitrite response regulator NarL
MKTAQMNTEAVVSTMLATKSPSVPQSLSLSGPAQPPRSSIAKPHPDGTVRGPSKMRGSIRVLLVDDHPVVRKGIGSCLARLPQLVVVGEAADGLEAMARARELLPDVVLLDLDLPKMSGLAVAEALHKELPKIKVLILSMCLRPEYLPRVLQAGARGYVLKEASPEELAKAVETVIAGECYFSPEIARLALKQVVQGNGAGSEGANLTNREREVLILVAKGLSNKDIANSLIIGVRTVETHRERIMRKLDIHSVAGLTRYAIAKSLITLRDEMPRPRG